uniref:RRM domain-containing protein n=1 Tax=Alexandrium monilatum TaxID=311494 RepID=A0A6T1N5T9_9DINO
MAQADRPSWHPADPFPGVSFPRCHGLGRRRQGLGRPWGKGGDKAKGKGKGGRAKGHRDMGFTNEQKVWIGGIPENATFKELFELLKPAGAKWCECFDGNGKGTGVACFSSQEEAQEAIAKFQGSPLNGAPLQLDVWEKKPKTT